MSCENVSLCPRIAAEPSASKRSSPAASVCNLRRRSLRNGIVQSRNSEASRNSSKRSSEIDWISGAMNENASPTLTSRLSKRASRERASASALSPAVQSAAYWFSWSVRRSICFSNSKTSAKDLAESPTWPRNFETPSNVCCKRTKSVSQSAADWKSGFRSHWSDSGTSERSGIGIDDMPSFLHGKFFFCKGRP